MTLTEWLGSTKADLKLVLHPVAEPLTSHDKPATLAFLIGPEGGLSDNEVEQAKASGFHAARLGPRVLRTEILRQWWRCRWHSNCGAIFN